jgi:hypothetical protein
MTAQATGALMGAVAMASFVAAIFFLRFWRQTRDRFFMWFALGFATDSATRFSLALLSDVGEAEPLFYLARLLMFALIIIAIIGKNRQGAIKQ